MNLTTEKPVAHMESTLFFIKKLCREFVVSSIDSSLKIAIVLESGELPKNLEKSKSFLIALSQRFP